MCIAGVDEGGVSPQDCDDQLYDLYDPKLICIRVTRFICAHFPVVTYRTRLICTHLVRDDLHDLVICTDMQRGDLYDSCIRTSPVWVYPCNPDQVYSKRRRQPVILMTRTRYHPRDRWYPDHEDLPITSFTVSSESGTQVCSYFTRGSWIAQMLIRPTCEPYSTCPCNIIWP